MKNQGYTKFESVFFKTLSHLKKKEKKLFSLPLTTKLLKFSYLGTTIKLVLMLITWAVFHPQYQLKSFNLMIILFFMPTLIYARTNIVNNRCYCLSDVGDIHLQKVLIIISKKYYTIIDI